MNNFGILFSNYLFIFIKSFLGLNFFKPLTDIAIFIVGNILPTPAASLVISVAAVPSAIVSSRLLFASLIAEDDLVKIEEKMKEIIKQNLTFERYEIPDVEAQIEEFKKEGEIYKAELLEEHKNDNPTLYITKDKEGNALFNDLCAATY